MKAVRTNKIRGFYKRLKQRNKSLVYINQLKEQLEISAMSGEEVAELVTKVNATPPAIVERVKHALQTPP